MACGDKKSFRLGAREGEGDGGGDLLVVGLSMCCQLQFVLVSMTPARLDSDSQSSIRIGFSHRDITKLLIKIKNKKDHLSSAG